MATEKRLIDADALMDAFCNTYYPDEIRRTIYFGSDTHRLMNFVVKKIRELILNAPTVDAVEVVHGRWVVEHEESIRCSECCFNRASIKMPLNYCPNCGTKMDLK